MTDGEGLPARRAALAAIDRVERDGAYSTIAVPEAIADLPEARDRSFAAHLAYDTLRWRGTLDWALDHVLDRSLEDVEAALIPVLRMGAGQILNSGVPARAAVSTAVELARERVPDARSRGAAGFVNGVLRGLVRSVEDLPWPDPDREPVRHLSLRTAHPAWIVEDLRARVGHEIAAEVLAGDNDPPGLTLRANGDRDALIEELRAQGLEAHPTEEAPDGVRAPGGDPRRLAAVAEGRAVPQDEASLLAVHAARSAAGERVLDLCAGPGGKATHLAHAVGGEGRVVAVELHEHRAGLVREAAERQGVQIDVRVGDGTDPPLAADERFDVVLVDAPCTGLGAGRRRPEVRWRRTPEDAAELAGLQRRLLSAAHPHLAPGGRLVYAACTWTAVETDGVADSVDAGDAGSLTLRRRRQLLPGRDGTDGMFIAVWHRVPR